MMGRNGPGNLFDGKNGVRLFPRFSSKYGAG